jgi:uncharacterized protein (DUF1501 family)
MLQFESTRGVEFCDGLTRRDFLRVGTLAAGAVGLSLADLGRLGAAGRSGPTSCILLFLVGGPSHLDTWDPKPLAPANVRGPFRPIRTNLPGIDLSETFPLMAQMADRYAVVRSVHHTAAPIHETGHQLMQTGRLFRNGLEYPHYGSVVSHLHGPARPGVPPFVVVGGPIGNTGVSVNHGQTAGSLGAAHQPVVCRVEDFGYPMLKKFDTAERACQGAGDPALAQVFSPQARKAFVADADWVASEDRYGRSLFGRSCHLARRLVDGGVRLVTVNMFDTVFDRTTWDCHADGGSLATTLADYKDILCPMFDRAYTALLSDLHQRGMLERTLVVAMGEFGRTPQLNPRGGRDHWPGCWSILLAGGGVRGGQVIGASDATGSEPKDRPVGPAELAATIYRALGIDLDTMLPGPDGRLLPLVDAQPIAGLV